MSRGTNRRPGYANVAATAALVLAIGGGTVAIGGVVGADGEIQACFDKKGRGQGDLRLLVKGKCARGERPIAWNQEGPRGPAGAGSPDTPQQVLDKLVQVDGAGSGLDADLLDGESAAEFARGADVLTKA